MSDHRRCTRCGDWGWFGNKVMPEHRCKPIWECRGAWEDYAGADWSRVHAADAEEAAERFAEQYDCDGEYPIVGNKMRCDVIIYVRAPLDLEDDPIGPRVVEQFAIEAEAVPNYYATKIEKRAAA